MNLKKMNYIGIIWGFILLSLVILLTVFGFVYKNKTKDYRKLEEKIVNISEKYVESKFLYPDENKTLKITLEELKNEELIDELKKDEDICDGYVELSYDGHVYHYKGYIKCANYTTKDYRK